MIRVDMVDPVVFDLVDGDEILFGWVVEGLLRR